MIGTGAVKLCESSPGAALVKSEWVDAAPFHLGLFVLPRMLPLYCLEIECRALSLYH